MTRSRNLEKIITELVTRFNELWSQGGVKIAVNATAPGVILPKQIVDNAPKKIITLQQSDGSSSQISIAVVLLNYPLHPVIPIDDLQVGTTGISATLSFNRTPHKTFIPWTATLGLASLYDEPDGEELPPAVPPKRGHLRSIP